MSATVGRPDAVDVVAARERLQSAADAAGDAYANAKEARYRAQLTTPLSESWRVEQAAIVEAAARDRLADAERALLAFDTEHPPEPQRPATLADSWLSVWARHDQKSNYSAAGKPHKTNT